MRIRKSEYAFDFQVDVGVEVPEHKGSPIFARAAVPSGASTGKACVCVCFLNRFLFCFIMIAIIMYFFFFFTSI